ncbi:hypothetical protein L9F63_018007, partial [Diploptera punctata]
DTLKGLAQLEKAPWLAPADKVELFQNKGQTEENYQSSTHQWQENLHMWNKRFSTSR